MSGYVPASGLGAFANPQGYILARNSINPPQPVATWNHQATSATGSGTYGKNQWFEVEFKTKNTGNQTWSKGGNNPVRLATDRPHDRSSVLSTGMGGRGWLTPNRIEMVADTPPGGIATFKAVMNAGAVPPGAAENAAAVARASEQGEVANMTVDFEAGQTTLGAVNIGPAPRVY